MAFTNDTAKVVISALAVVASVVQIVISSGGERRLRNRVKSDLELLSLARQMEMGRRTAELEVAASDSLDQLQDYRLGFKGRWDHWSSAAVAFVVAITVGWSLPVKLPLNLSWVWDHVLLICGLSIAFGVLFARSHSLRRKDLARIRERMRTDAETEARRALLDVR